MTVNKSIKPEVLLVCSRLDSIGLARFPSVLFKAGCRVTLLSPLGLAVNRSRFVSVHIPTSNELEAIVQHLKELLSSTHSDFAQVILGDELISVAVAEHRGEAWLDGWFPVDHRSQAIEIINSKHAFYFAMVDAGLYMPPSQLCTGWAEVEATVTAQGYPLILKSSEGCAAWGVRKVCNSDELEVAYSELTVKEPVVLVQQICEGLLGETEILFDKGVPVCWHSNYRPECWPTPMSPSSARSVMYHQDIEHITTEIGRITGFHGFASFDWIHETSSDRICILEMNSRPTPFYHLARYSGVNFSCSLNKLLSGQCNITPPKQFSTPGKVIRLFPQSLYSGIANSDWRCFILAWIDAPWDDPALMVAFVRRLINYFRHNKG